MATPRSDGSGCANAGNVVAASAAKKNVAVFCIVVSQMEQADNRTPRDWFMLPVPNETGTNCCVCEMPQVSPEFAYSAFMNARIGDHSGVCAEFASRFVASAG